MDGSDRDHEGGVKVWVQRERIVASGVAQNPGAGHDIVVATCNRKPANLQSRVFFNRHYLQLTVPKTDIKCN